MFNKFIAATLVSLMATGVAMAKDNDADASKAQFGPCPYMQAAPFMRHHAPGRIFQDEIASIMQAKGIGTTGYLTVNDAKTISEEGVKVLQNRLDKLKDFKGLDANHDNFISLDELASLYPKAIDDDKFLGFGHRGPKGQRFDKKRHGPDCPYFSKNEGIGWDDGYGMHGWHRGSGMHGWHRDFRKHDRNHLNYAYFTLACFDKDGDFRLNQDEFSKMTAKRVRGLTNILEGFKALANADLNNDGFITIREANVSFMSASLKNAKKLTEKDFKKSRKDD